MNATINSLLDALNIATDKIHQSNDLVCALSAQVETLTKERDALALCVDQWKVDFHELSLERDALATAAARYQFMKSRSRVLGLNMNGNHSWTCQITGRDIVGPTLDDAISEAMRQVGVL